MVFYVALLHQQIIDTWFIQSFQKSKQGWKKSLQALNFRVLRPDFYQLVLKS